MPGFTTQVLPNLRAENEHGEHDDERHSCIYAEVPWHIVGQWTLAAEYATQVSGSTGDFLLITPEGRRGILDGRTPGTRHLWEAKLGYAKYVESYGVKLNSTNVIIEIDLQALEENFVTKRCMYDLTYAFSNPIVANFFQQRWRKLSAFEQSPFPQDIRWIKFNKSSDAVP
jgi:hypothetical protein